MPLYTVYCLDAPGMADTRLATRPAHLDYVRSCGDIVRVAGPLQAEDGETALGSMFILDVPDRAAAEAFSAGDPYVKAGVFGSVGITRFRWLINPPADLA